MRILIYHYNIRLDHYSTH